MAPTVKKAICVHVLSATGWMRWVDWNAALSIHEERDAILSMSHVSQGRALIERQI